MLYNDFINAPQTFITTVGLYNDENELIDWRILEPEELPDQDFASLLHQSSLMAEYNNSYVYRLKD